MSLKISPEQRQALLANSGSPVEVEDDQTQQTYVLVSKKGFHDMVDEVLRRRLQIGFDQADNGDVADWDIDEILAEAHLRHRSRTTST
jgi:hypothetical protein